MDIGTVGTPRLTWRRLLLLVEQLTGDPQSALFRELNPHWEWDLHAQLQAITANALRVANWQRTEDGGKRSPKHFPDPYLPPWVTPAGENRQAEKFGDARMTLAETNEFLGW